MLENEFLPENDNLEFGNGRASLDLAPSQALEYLALYSSQIGNFLINNTILLDSAGYILGYKYNGVDKQTSDESIMLTLTNIGCDSDGIIYAFNLEGKCFKIPKKIKYNDNKKQLLYKAFNAYFKTQNPSLFDNI